MEDKLHDFFNQNEFDIHEPHSGHLARFERKLKGVKPQRKISWTWMSVAAAVILSIGFGLGNLTKDSNSYDLASISPKMGETQDYFVSAIQTNLVTLEKSRNLDTERVIELALNELEDLEDSFKRLVKELKDNTNQTKTIDAMILNYQQRLDVLKSALQQIETLKVNKNLDNEILI